MDTVNLPNRQNRTALPPTGQQPRASQIITSIIPANGSLPIFQQGTQFYVVVATGAIRIKPNNGSENDYVQGTGLEVDFSTAFANLTIKNANPFNVVIQIFVGFGGYIDNRLIISDPNVIDITYPTAPIPNTANEILIPDKSGQEILDINGKVFFAMKRVGLYVTNLDLASVYNLYGGADGTYTPVAPIALGIQPASNIVYPGSGKFRLKLPAGNLNAIVSEIYSSIRPT